MATNYSPEIVTDGAVFVGDARMPSISDPGTRLYNRAGVDSADVKLLIHGNEGSGQSFTDSSLSNHTITAVGNATHSTTKSKFSGGSMYFDGSGDWLQIADSADWNNGSDDFTWDAWIYPTSISDHLGIIHQGEASGNQQCNTLNVYSSGGDQIRWLIRNTSGTLLDLKSGNGTLLLNAWSHVAAIRQGTYFKIYINGVLQVTSSSIATAIEDLPHDMYVGNRYTVVANYEFVGYIDEARITKGVALWTQNFTPPARRDTLSISDGMMYNGTSLNFDNTDDYITINGFASNDPGTDSAWAVTFRARGDTATGSANHDMVFSGHTTSGGNIIRIGYDRTNGGIFYSDDNTTDKYAGTTFYNDNTWHHVVITRPSGSGAQTTDVYVDGAKITGGTFSTSDPTWASATQFSIGQEWDTATPGDYFDGDLADIRVYNVKLSATQVTELYNDSKVVVPSNVSLTNLLGWWPLCEGAGSIAYDGSGKGSHGTLINSPGWNTGQTGPPQLVEGYNRPMSFASSKYVEVPQDSALDVGTSDFTVSAWIWPKTGSQTNMFMQFAGAGGWRLLGGGSDKTRFTIFDNGWSNYAFMDVTPALTRNQWSHFAVSVDRDGNAQSYINGVAKSYVSVSGVTGTLTNAYPLRFGAGSYTNGAPTGDYMDGVMNEAIIYIGTALNAADIAALAATGPNGGPLPPDPTTMTYSTTSYSSSYLKGYWRNDGDVTWTDRSGNGNTGTANGSPDALLFKQGYNGRLSTSTGRDGQGFPLKYKDVGAVGFSSGDHIEVSQSDSFKFGTGGFAIAFWFLCADFSNSDGGHYDRLFMLGDDFNTNSLNINIKTDGKIQFRWNDSTIVSETSAISTDQWYYFVATRAGGTLYLYLNGVLEDSDSFTTNVNNAGDYGLALGAERGGLTTTSLHGSMSGAQIYNRALSQAEIKQNFNAQASRFQVPRSIVTDGLVLWLDAGDPTSYPGSGTTWYDLSGNDYDATLVGGPTVTSRGVELNGSTQYITLAHGGNLAFSSGDFTISVWCNYNGGTYYGGIITNDYSGDNAWKIFKDTTEAYFKARSGSTIVNFPAYTLDTFHCYTFTRTASLLQVYFDGVVSYSASSPASPTSYNDIAFGSYRYTDALNLLYLNNQTIGTTTLYNRALSAAEVGQNFRVQRERFGV
jgi:hypothetical protein